MNANNKRTYCFVMISKDRASFVAHALYPPNIMILFESQPEDHIIESDLPKGCNLSEVWYIDHVHV